ncbi:MAG: ArgE/DapE family deacylase, partial [Acidihalobacter sp.]
MLTDTEKRIEKRCDELLGSAVELTRDLVQGYSVLGNEQGTLDTMERWLGELDLPVERVPLDAPGLDENPHHAPVAWPAKGRYNVMSRLNPGANGPHLVLNGHLDVVPAEPVEMWTRAPWEPWEQDGWLYGRGAGDMKAGIAGMVMAVRAVREAGVAIDFPLSIQTVIEEECSGNGALACVHQGHGGDFVLIPEPFGAQIYTGQIGVLWFKLSVQGVPAHVLDTTAGSNAIEYLQQYIPGLKRLEDELNAARRPAPYDAVEHPFNLNIGRIQGGNWASSVPAYAELEGRIGFPVGMSPEEIMQRVRQAVTERHVELSGGGAQPPMVEFHGFRSEGHLVDLESPGVRLLERCHEDLTGTTAPHYLSTCTTDLRAFQVAGGVPGTCYGPVAQRIHGLAGLIDHLLARGELPVDAVEDLSVGCALPVRDQWNFGGRYPQWLSRLGHGCATRSIDQQCGSGLAALRGCAREIQAGAIELGLAGGYENMTRVPMGPTLFDEGVLTVPPSVGGVERVALEVALNMGLTAENLAAEAGITREDMDAFALASHQRAAAAESDGFLAGERVALPDAEGNAVDLDANIRADTSLDKLAGLKPAFREDGIV